MRHDQRQRILMPRPDVDEVNLDPVDLGCELRQRVQSCLAPAPVVLGRPVAGERLQRRQLHALGAVCNELFRRPTRRLDPAAQLSELLFGNLDLERTYVGGGLRGSTQDNLRSGAAGRTTSALVGSSPRYLLPGGPSNEWD
jgi:hypothetical protein